MPRALGVDVGVRKGLDVVLMDETLAPADTLSHVTLDDLGALIDRLRPDVVAIDSPPSWGLNGGCRQTELALRSVGIMSYGTPSDPKKGQSAFYEWMRRGFQVFDVAAARGFHRYGRGAPQGTAIEVFPYASAVVLAGTLPPRSARKRDWRTAVLRSVGVATSELRSVDQVDAALAALTGYLALTEAFVAPGDPDEGVIVLPLEELPSSAYRRAEAEAVEPQASLPGLAPCRCGDPACRSMTSREFAPGHDAKRKALLWRVARQGDRAVRELDRRHWDRPPELR